MKLLVLWLLCISRAAASYDCGKCLADEVSCIDKSDSLQVCGNPTNCTTKILQINCTSDFVHVHKNENASIVFDIVAPNVTDVSVTVITPNGTDFILDDAEKSEYIINEATKEMEGRYKLVASGTYNNQTVCSADDATLYVFTVSISLRNAFYAFKKDTTSTIYITVRSEAGDWSRIHLYEYAPISKVQRLDLIELDERKFVYTHPYQLSTPVEGVYTFKVEETSPYATTYSTEASAEVYVLTTDIIADKTTYYTELGGNISIPLMVTSDVATDSIVIQVTKPEREIHNITESLISGSSLIYNVSNVGVLEIGKYKFSASEHVDDRGLLLSSQLEIDIHTINATSLITYENGRFIAIKGINSSITCSSTDSNLSLTWLFPNATVVTELENRPVYQVATGTTAILLISDKADFSTFRSFTCASTALNISKDISVQGPSVEPTLEFMNNAFTCKSSGNPTPSLSWKLEDANIEDLFQTPTKASSDFEATSTLSPKIDLSCLGNLQISCIANNSYSTVNSTMPVNDGAAWVFFDEYIIFRSKRGTFSYANATCNMRLLTLKSNDKKSFVSNAAEESRVNVTEFFTGATKNESHGNWTYPDGTIAVVVDEDDDKDRICSKYRRETEKGSWILQACDCNEELTVVCEIKDDDPPKNLRLNPDECDGKRLTARWDAPANVTSQRVTRGSDIKSLEPSANTIDFTNLNESTSYIVKVEAIRKYCQLNPFIKIPALTVGPPDEPKSLELASVETKCNLTWSPSDPANIKDIFVVTVMSTVVVNPNEEFPPTSRTREFNATTFQFEISMQANTNYTATIYSKSCAGNSTTVMANGSCKSPIGPPNIEPPPVWPLSPSGATVETSIPKSNNRSGPVTCQFMVVHYIGENDSADVAMDENRFNNIKQADQPVEVGEEYFAYATRPLAASEDITLGNGGESSCVPSPVTSSTITLRSIQKGTAYSAKNRKFPEGRKFRCFMIETVADTTHVYMAKSTSSPVYVIETRDEPSGSNATVVVLSILVVIIFGGLACFLFRRWRRPKNRPGFLRFSYSANAGHDYDTL